LNCRFAAIGFIGATSAEGRPAPARDRRAWAAVRRRADDQACGVGYGSYGCRWSSAAQRSRSARSGHMPITRRPDLDVGVARQDGALAWTDVLAPRTSLLGRGLDAGHRQHSATLDCPDTIPAFGGMPLPNGDRQDANSLARPGSRLGSRSSGWMRGPWPSGQPPFSSDWCLAGYRRTRPWCRQEPADLLI